MSPRQSREPIRYYYAREPRATDTTEAPDAEPAKTHPHRQNARWPAGWFPVQTSAGGPDKASGPPLGPRGDARARGPLHPGQWRGRASQLAPPSVRYALFAGGGGAGGDSARGPAGPAPADATGSPPPARRRPLGLKPGWGARGSLAKATPAQGRRPCAPAAPGGAALGRRQGRRQQPGPAKSLGGCSCARLRSRRSPSPSRRRRRCGPVRGLGPPGLSAVRLPLLRPAVVPRRPRLVVFGGARVSGLWACLLRAVGGRVMPRLRCPRCGCRFRLAPAHAGFRPCCRWCGWLVPLAPSGAVVSVVAP